jgi:hypothetical protein
MTHSPNDPRKSDLARSIRPVAIYAYADQAQVWLVRPVTGKKRESLEKECGKGGLDVRDMVPRWDRSRSYEQRLQLRQPSRKALEILAQRGGVHLNRAELALDLVFATADELQAAYEFACRHSYKKYRGKQKVRYYHNAFTDQSTRYSAARALNLIAIYADKPCRIDGSLFCLHFDWRISGAEALRRAGITSVGDLLDFDHRAFWERHLRMRAVDLDMFERLYLVHFGCPPDRRVKQICARTDVQSIVDNFRKRFDVGRCLIEIDVSHWLPTGPALGRRGPFFYDNEHISPVPSPDPLATLNALASLNGSDQDHTHSESLNGSDQDHTHSESLNVNDTTNDITQPTVIQSTPHATQLGFAQALILRQLEKQPLPALELQSLASSHGISSRTLNRAKKSLGVLSKRNSGHWDWSLPGTGADPSHD